jgi:ABC-type phosphate transport system substrate-binding protein
MKKYLAVSLALSLVLVAAPARAGHDEGPAGKPFTDPSKIQEMPPGWEGKPIKLDTGNREADLVVTLDQHLYPILLPVIERYAAERGLEVEVEEGTCGISAGKLARKAVDIGGFCCPPGNTDRLPGLEFHTLGVAPILILVHPENPVSDLSVKDVRRVFRGAVYRWFELGGKDILIQTVGRLHCKLRPGHWRLILDNEDLFSPRLQEVGAIPDMISLVAGNPGAVGYEVMHMVRRYREKGAVKALKVDGKDPADPGHLVSGRYPFYRTYNITTWQGENVRNPEAEKLAEHLLKEAGRLEGEGDIIPASRLKEAGWKFKGNELVGEPK